MHFNDGLLIGRQSILPPSQTGSRYYYRADEKLSVVQRYDFRVSSSANLGSWEEYWYDALGRRILTRARRSGSPPVGAGTLCNDPVGNTCQSYWQRTVWDGDQLLYEWRTPDGTSTGMNSGYAGYVHVEGLDQPLGLIRSDGTRVLNYNWRGLGESTVFTNGAPGDASIFGGTVAVDWPTRTQGAVYFTPNVLASGPNGPYTWFGTLAENGAGSTGLLYKRNRYFDPVSGRFTQADPIGLAGGLNLYGFASGDPVNYSDPFGLCPNGPSPCEQLGITLGGAIGVGAGALVAGGCTIGSGGICAAGAPGIVLAGSGLGSSIGGLVGRLADMWLARGGSMQPDPAAEGPHTTFIPDANGRVKKYQEWAPNEPRHPRDPHRFKPGKRYDREGPTHSNPDGTRVPTPHINEPNGTARPPRPTEIPR